MTQEKALKPTKQVQDLKTLVDRLVTAHDTYAATIGQGFEKVLGRATEGAENVPDMAVMTRLLARRMARLGEHMVEADLANQREQSDDHAPQHERDKQDEHLRKELNEVKEMATGLYGSGVLETFKLGAPLPTDSKGLVAYAQEASAAIRGTAVESLPKPRIKGASADLDEWAAPLERVARELDGALNAVANEARQAEAALRAKNQAVENIRKAFEPATHFLQHMLQFVGESARAERIKPFLKEGGALEEEAKA